MDLFSTNRPPLPPGNIPSMNFLQRLGRPQVHCAVRRIMSIKKIPKAPSGIESATFQLVTQTTKETSKIKIIAISSDLD